MMRAAAEKDGFTMYDKWGVLAGDAELLGQVNRLNFDQLAIVDYNVMQAAVLFLGIGRSTFSLVIAYGRARDRGYDIVDHLGRAASPNGQPLWLIGSNDTLVLDDNSHALQIHIAGFP